MKEKNIYLILVESPVKSKTLKRFLGKKYQIAATMGHIRDLPEKKFGIDIKKDFQPTYILIPKAKKTVQIIKNLSNKASEVILASVDYKEPILIQCPDNSVQQFEVGAFIDEILEKKIDFSKFKVSTFNFKNHKISFKPIKGISRHPIKEKILELELEYGRKIRITPSHSVFTKDNNGKIKAILGENLKTGDKILVPLKLLRSYQEIKEIDLLKEVYQDQEFCKKVFINSPKVSQYQREKVLAPKIGNIPQFQLRLILSSKLRRILKRKREEFGWSQKFLANKINCSQPHVCELEKRENPTLTLGKRYLESLDLTLEKVIKNPGAKIASSSIEVAIKNALDNQWRDSRKSLTHTQQPLTRFNWKEIKRNFKEDKEIKISRHNHLHLMPRFIPVNEDLMLFLGFFIAEGNYIKNGGAVKFSFGKKMLGGEKENIEKVKKISQNLFNLSPSDFEDGNSNSAVLNSSLVGFLMKKFLKIKGGSKAKEIPWIVFNVPWQLQLSFLEGLFLGDGSLNKGSISFNTVSSKLAQGTRFLFLQNGILTSHSLAISKKQSKKSINYQVNICGKERLLKIKPIWEKHYKAKVLEKYLQRKDYRSDIKKNWSLIQNQKRDLGLLKIKKIKKVKSSSLFVYDFSTDEENFICGNGAICAHNTDPDREGEAIAWHLAKILNLNGQNPYQRIVFHEITKPAIEEALKNPRKININLVDAQQARRILDRLVGYKLSPFLWKKVARGLSAGRVQSVAVRLVVEREREIQNFIPQEYWTITAQLKKLGDRPRQVLPGSDLGKFEAGLVKKDNKVIPKLGIKTKKEADEIIKDLKGAEYKVINVEKKEVRRNPLPPFTTSTLQQEAWQRFKWPAKMTMRFAQQLYETGKITYHRTDSLNLSDLSLFAAKKFIVNNYGKDYWAGFLRRYKAKGRVQEAHEAIRPTRPNFAPQNSGGKIYFKDKNAEKLYDLIWRRFISSQMAQAIFDSTAVDIEAKNYGFKAAGQILKFDGFLKVYPIKFAGLRPSHASAKASASEERELPPLEVDEILELIKLISSQHFTKPAPRYTEATLIKALEQNGIGRPSTYAPILSTIQERNYIEKDENKRFLPTEIGTVVNDLLVNHFPKIVDIKFTAGMEEDLDKIAQGKEKWVPLIREFYGPFEENLKQKEKEIQKADIAQETTKKICPKCGSPLLIRLGKFGKFYACSKFPKCKYTESLKKTALGIKCSKCKKGEIVEKRTKKGKIFYGCNLWPKCDFALWDKPTGEICQKCKSLLVETKRKQVKCSNKECNFQVEK